jgi:hypothetical protein
MSKQNQLNIDGIAFIGRTYAEYMSIFDLDETLLGRGPVLDCAAGPSSFTAEASKKGFDVTACDINYNQIPLDLFKKGVRDISHVFNKFDEADHLYTWDFYRDKEHVVSHRKMALGGFVKDFTRNKKSGRYVHSELPSLPFNDNTFSLALVSHFLFLYCDRLDFDFHLLCINELMRVCSEEVRIFPLVGLDAKTYIQMDNIMASLVSGGWEVEITKVPFEFQRGANQMMKIKL